MHCLHVPPAPDRYCNNFPPSSGCDTCIIVVAGFYADPENCRWFFACVDHGSAGGALTAYEFRCPFGLGFDQRQLRCDWPWLVDACGDIGRYEEEAHGSSAHTLTGATGFQGRTVESVNIAAHKSLASGAALNNLVGIQGGFLERGDTPDDDAQGRATGAPADFLLNDDYYLGSQGEPSGLSYNVVAADAINKGLVQARDFGEEDKYTSGSIILDDYRLPSKPAGTGTASGNIASRKYQSGEYDPRKYQSGKYDDFNNGKYRSGAYRKDNRGAYVHNPIGDKAKPYQHIDVPAMPYKHLDNKYPGTSDFDRGNYSGDSDRSTYTGSYDAGAYIGDDSRNRGGYEYPRPDIEFNEGFDTTKTSEYNIEDSGSSTSGGRKTTTANGNSESSQTTYLGSYGHGDAAHTSDYHLYSGASHTLTAGAVNVGLVGKTTLVDKDIAIGGYNTGAFNKDIQVTSGVSQAAVSINHAGTDAQNFNGYTFATTPTSSGVPTTATPFAVTTAIPTIYRTTYVTEPPRTSIKQIFGYTQPAVTVVQPATVAVKHTSDVLHYNQGAREAETVSAYAGGSTSSVATGYHYSKPSVQFKEGIDYTKSTPEIKLTKLKPQGFAQSQQTFHTEQISLDIVGAVPVTEEPFKKLVAYTTGPPYVQPGAQSFTRQTFYNSGTAASDISRDSITNNAAVFESSTPQPDLTYTPSFSRQTFTQQTLHSINTDKASFSQSQSNGYEYNRPTYTKSESSSNQYSQPAIQYNEVRNVLYESSQPSGYSSQTFQQQGQISEVKPTITQDTVYDSPAVQYPVKTTPTIQQTFVPNALSNQYSEIEAIDVRSDFDDKSTASFIQPAVSTYQSHGFVGRNAEAYGNTYSNEPSTATSIVLTTERPQVYSQQAIHKTEQGTVTLPRVPLTYQATVSIHENPLLKYNQKNIKVTPASTLYTQVKETIVNDPAAYQVYGQRTRSQPVYKGYSYEQPEIQRNVEIIPNYSDASAVSHQLYHQTQVTNGAVKSNKDIVLVSTTPASLIYEDHYAQYETPRPSIPELPYQTAEFVRPKSQFQEYYSLSTSARPDNVYVRSQDLDYKSEIEQYDVNVPTQTFSQTKFSSGSSLNTNTQYEQTRYESPEIQTFKGEDYLPPVVVTAAPLSSTYRPVTTTYRPVTTTYRPVTTTYRPVTTTYKPATSTYRPVTPYRTTSYRPRTYSTTTTREYLPPASEDKYSDAQIIPSGQTTSTIQQNENRKIPTVDYFPPTQKPRVGSYQSFGYNKEEELDSGAGLYEQDYSVSTQEPHVVSTLRPVKKKQNIVIETAKSSNLLGFGTIGPDAGLVTTSYSTSQPIVSTYTNLYLPPHDIPSTPTEAEVDIIPATIRSRPKYYRPAVTTRVPYTTSTTDYRAPEYLPPEDVEQERTGNYGFKSEIEQTVDINNNPYQSSTPSVSSTTRKQNVVVESFKSSQSRYGLEDELLASGIQSTLAPVELSSRVSSTPTTGTYGTSTRVPLRRTRPKVAVVTKINDFNPLLVRKLGAVCSCQSPVLVLKGGRPTTQQAVVEYTDEDSGRGDNDDTSYLRKSLRVSTPASIISTVAPSSTNNPIIVSEDSFYQDYQDNDNTYEIAGSGRSENVYVSSSTPAVSERVVRIRPKVKAVSVAPINRTVVEDASFARYGPGGWRGRHERLQGAVDCQRAGLFRHPQQCNKFYACRWDCSKQRFTLHVFDCPVQLSFDPALGACNWPSQGPACQTDTLLTNSL
ncbi:uncharacterized protein LOC126978573 [Leptidea sinapis]|uniref:uncharacterized protein LOC126978573 n=1 Tax=Leptidea sinapis TaxID=189913 RepID=UPI0021C2606B|nr:uncharacterized protein LOC126978573 [Leptidea sinapis]